MQLPTHRGPDRTHSRSTQRSLAASVPPPTWGCATSNRSRTTRVSAATPPGSRARGSGCCCRNRTRRRQPHARSGGRPAPAPCQRSGSSRRCRPGRRNAPLSEVTELAQLQLRLNKLCAAAVESRTVIPVVAFDLFLAQHGDDAAHQADANMFDVDQQQQEQHEDDVSSPLQQAGVFAAAFRACGSPLVMTHAQSTVFVSPTSTPRAT